MRRVERLAAPTRMTRAAPPRKLAGLPTLRPGALAFDFAYARAILDAEDADILDALIALWPNARVRMYIQHGELASRGSTPAEWDGLIVTWPLVARGEDAPRST